MKTLIALLITLITNSVLSQFVENDNIVNYRVVALKNMDNGIESVSNIVSQAKKLHIQVPNAFSPDGDGVNDGFTVVSDGVEVFSMEVYNRWGEVVYYTDDIEEPWTGEYDGAKCQQDAYVYVIHARGVEGEARTTLKGTISLIR